MIICSLPIRSTEWGEGEACSILEGFDKFDNGDLFKSTLIASSGRVVKELGGSLVSMVNQTHIKG